MYLHRLHVNDKKYLVHPPERAKLSLEEGTKVGDVRAIVAQVSKWKLTFIKFYYIRNENRIHFVLSY